MNGVQSRKLFIKSSLYLQTVFCFSSGFAQVHPPRRGAASVSVV